MTVPRQLTNELSPCNTLHVQMQLTWNIFCWAVLWFISVNNDAGTVPQINVSHDDDHNLGWLYHFTCWRYTSKGIDLARGLNHQRVCVSVQVQHPCLGCGDLARWIIVRDACLHFLDYSTLVTWVDHGQVWTSSTRIPLDATWTLFVCFLHACFCACWMVARALTLTWYPNLETPEQRPIQSDPKHNCECGWPMVVARSEATIVSMHTNGSGVCAYLDGRTCAGPNGVDILWPWSRSRIPWTWSS